MRRPKKFKRIFFIVIILGLLGGSIGSFVVLSIASTLPSVELLETPIVAESTKIFDRTGKILLYEITGPEKRTVVSFEDIPNSVRQATIAIEDSGFYEHPAFDWKSITRAFLKNIAAGEITQGGSTITQQLAKNAFLSREQTLTRKIKELILAMRLEKRFSKDEILHLYLNQIPYGSNLYGIESASRAFFGKSVKDATLSEAAVLASVPKAPTYYSPWGSHVPSLEKRKNLVLENMFQLGYITLDEKKKAQETQLVFQPPNSSIKAPHFVIAVQEYLINQYGEEFVRTAGLNVTTTLDAKLQEVAEKVVKEGAERNEKLYEGKNAALVAQDTTTGQVLALVGSRDYFNTEIDGNFNVATQGLRQPGSAMKPIVYLEAFRRGYQPETIVFDLKTEFDTTKNPERSYQPENFDEQFRGPINLRNALAQSINVPSVKVLYLAGIDNVLETARALGLTTLTERARYGLSLVLGGGEVKLIDLVGAYATFSQDGIRRPSALVLKVEAKSKKVLEEYRDQGEQVVEAEPIRVINNILSDTDARAALFHSSLSLTLFPGHEVALKTGTTNDYRDAWAIGYTPSLAVGVWAGNSDNKPMQRRGGSILAAVPIWSEFMREALKDKPQEFFPKPGPVFNEKPMLRGEYLVSYRDSAGNEYPQIHDVLFYINKRDPRGPEPVTRGADSQFENWERPVLAWAAQNIPDYARYNKPLPPDAILAGQETVTAAPLNLTLLKPKRGEFIKDSLEIEADITSSEEIILIETYLNGSLIESRSNIGNTSLKYRTVIPGTNLKLQNSLKLVATDKTGKQKEEEVIFYKEVL